MTWAQYIATGNGALAFRLDVAGLPAQFVGLQGMAGFNSFGVQRRVVGLRMRGQKITERADIVNAKLEVGGMRPQIADVENLPSAYLGKVGHPTATTWLAANATASATTITVSSTTDFVSTDGYIWMDSECISYTAVTSTTFTGCTRGVFNTLAQAHYVADGASLRYPAVTNQPITLEGQRVRVYAYGELDSLSGDGTQIYTGVVASDPRYDGTAWSIGVDPVTRALNQKLGSGGSLVTQSRGIYYPANAPFVIQFILYATPFTTRGISDTKSISFPVTAADTGFFENNEAFCEYLNAKMAADSTISAWATKFQAVADGQFGWHMEVTTATAGHVAGRAVIGRPDGGAGFGASNIDQLDPFLRDRATGEIVTVTAVSSTYVQSSVDGYGSVPRGVLVGAVAPGYTPAVQAAFAAWPDGRVYTGGAVAPPSGTRTVIVTYPGGVRQHWPRAMSVTTGRIDLALMDRGAGWFTGTSAGYVGALELEYVVAYTLGGGVGDFVDALIAGAPADVNLGAGPDVRAADFPNTLYFRHADDGSPAFLVDQYFFGVPKHTVGDVVSAELQAGGQFMCLTSTGGIITSKLRAAIQSEASTSSVTQIFARSAPKYERSSRGLVNTVVFKTRYDAATDEHIGPNIVVRDVASFGRAPGAREVTIARLSTQSGPANIITSSQAVEAASRLFGVLGGSYAELTIEVPLSYYAVTVGSVVRVTARNVPSTDGTIGITDRAGIVIGREHDLTGGILTLSVLLGDASIAGYCPSASIATETNTSGDFWDVTLDNTEAPSGTTSASWFAVNDWIRVWRFDDTTPATMTGEVTAISGSTVTIHLDGAAALGTGVWVLEYDQAATWAANPDPPFLFLATSAGRVALPTPMPAWVFSP